MFWRKMKARTTLLILLVISLSGIHAIPAEAQVNDTLYSSLSQQPHGIWFHKTNSVFKRVAYSQAILWPASAAGHLGLYIRDGELGNLSNIYTLRMYKRTFTLPPVWDSDTFSWNYVVHPIMGSFSYLAYRNKRAHWAEAFAGAALNSAIYEYFIAGATQQPSINDMVMTPILGSLLGEGIYQLKKQMLRNRHLGIVEKIVMTVSDPFEVIYYGFNYRKICQVNYR